MPTISAFRSEFTGIEKLYEEAKREQWNASEDIDWSMEIQFDPSLDPEVARQHRAFVVGMCYEGEKLAITDTPVGLFMQKAPDLEARMFLATLLVDEVRHTEVFYRYLQKLDAPYELDGVFDPYIDVVKKAETFLQALVAGVVVEALAVEVVDFNSQACPLLRQILPLVEKDEARHDRFNSLYFQMLMEKSQPAERQQIQNIIETAIDAWKTSTEMVAERMPPLPRRQRIRQGMQWQREVKLAAERLQSHIAPWGLNCSERLFA